MRLVSRFSLPVWYNHNPYIINGYRPPNESVISCIKSMFYIHNESGNIWTHFIGFICYMIFMIQTFSSDIFKKFGPKDKLAYIGFFAGILTCFMLSTLYHTFQCHSRKVLRLCAKLDYFGITLLITLSIISWDYFAFYDSRTPFLIYTSLITCLAIICVRITLSDRFGAQEYQAIRGIVFIVKGFSGIAPFVHFCRYSYFPDAMSSHIVFKSLILLILMALIYVCGALIFIFKIPERLYPKKFDIWFNSHQLFHIMTITGGITFFHSMSLMAQSRLNYPSNVEHISTYVQ